MFSELFPQLDHQKRVIAKSVRKKRKQDKRPRDGRASVQSLAESFVMEKAEDESVPKAYRLGAAADHSSSDESVHETSDQEEQNPARIADDDSDSDSDSDTESDKHDDVQVSSLLSDMEKLKENMIKSNAYEKLKEKCRRSDSDDD